MATRTVPFAQTPRSPLGLRIPWWLLGLTLALSGSGAIYGGKTARGARRLSRATLCASGLAYLTISLLDFAEHFRLERQLTGKWFSATAVPPGETVNHGLTLLTVLGALALARPLPEKLAPRDLFALAAPALFLVLGWRDELVYHRRRALHREDLMHTVSHLAAGVMLTSLYLARGMSSPRSV